VTILFLFGISTWGAGWHGCNHITSLALRCHFPRWSRLDHRQKTGKWSPLCVGGARQCRRSDLALSSGIASLYVCKTLGRMLTGV